MIKHKPLPPLEELRGYLYLDPCSPSGLRWKKHVGGRSKKDKIAGTKRPDGYWCVAIKGSIFLSHRITYFMLTGEDPGEKWIDHVTIKTNNLDVRAATPAQNHANRNKGKEKSSIKLTSKYKGVSLHSINKNWVARINRDGKLKHLGSFQSENDAARAYNEAALEIWGEFARLNEIE